MSNMYRNMDTDEMINELENRGFYLIHDKYNDAYNMLYELYLIAVDSTPSQFMVEINKYFIKHLGKWL